METWKEIKDFPLYEVSSLGQVRNKKTGCILKPHLNKGYSIYCLQKEKKSYRKSAHRLLAETFLENPENKKEVDHINQNRADNRLENIRWASHSENQLNKTFKKTTNTNQKHITACKDGYVVVVQRNKVRKTKWASTIEEAIKVRDELLKENCS